MVNECPNRNSRKNHVVSGLTRLVDILGQSLCNSLDLVFTWFFLRVWFKQIRNCNIIVYSWIKHRFFALDDTTQLILDTCVNL